MADHDQRFKTLVREFFAEFMLLFFPTWAERFDFGQVEWLDKEVFPDPPRGQRRGMDLVAKLPTRQAVVLRKGDDEAWLALIHIEVESPDKAAPLRPRMCDYYHHLRRHGLPVLPIGLLLQVGLDGIGWDTYEERFWERTLLHFEYAYVGLPALEGQQYVQGENWLGVALAVLMRVPAESRARLKADALST